MIAITGHADLLETAAKGVDLILAKPWSPGTLLAFLQHKKRLQDQE